MNDLKRRVLSLAVISTTLAGCADSSVGTDSRALSPTPAVSGFAPAGAEVPDIAAMTDADRDAYGEALSDAQISITDAARGAATWADADRTVRRALRAALESDVGLPAYQIESMAATHMLTRAFQPGRASEAPAADIAFYTDLLIRNESPNAPLIADALEALDGTWTEPEVRSAATRTIAAAEHFAEMQAARAAPSEGDRLAAEADRQAGRGTAQAEQTDAAVRRLRTLAAD